MQRLFDAEIITTAGDHTSTEWVAVEANNIGGTTVNVPSVFSSEYLEECRICQLDFCYEWCQKKILEREK